MAHGESSLLTAVPPDPAKVAPDRAPLSAAKRHLLEKALKGELSRSPTGRSRIPRHPRGAPIPLSFPQQHLWFLTQLAAGMPVFNEPITIHRLGSLDVAALAQAFVEIIRRHEAWRTTFEFVDGEPVQLVHAAPATFALPLVDLRSIPEDQREAEALRLAAVDAQRPFDLARGPLLRATLVRLEEDEHRLFLTLHHIIFDGVSIYNVLLPELTTLYEAFASGRSSPLPEPEIQYADFAAWQRRQLTEDALSARLAYWRRQLAGAPEMLELPADRSRPPVNMFRGAHLPFALSRDLTESLRALAQGEGATLFMTLLATFQTLLLRYTGQEDVVMGVITAGRDRAEIERLLGFFLNTVVLRADLSGNPSFRELLVRAKETLLEALANEVPFEQLVRQLAPRRDPSRYPLFQALFSLEPLLEALPPGWRLTQMDIHTGAGKFDLSLELDDRPEGIIGRFIYNTDLFESATVARMSAHWQTLLAAIVADPDRPLSRLPVLTDSERVAQRLARNAVGPRNSFLEFRREEIEQSITGRFEEQARRHGSRTAVQTRTRCWNYQRLAEETDRVAQTLWELDREGGGDRIALLFEQDAPMIAAILGSLKAGKTYVPLDPSYPAERLSYMLEDSGAAVILTNDRNFSIASSLGKEKYSVENLDRRRPGSCASPSPTQTGPDAAAYILYTSGSTGRPKGVLQNHRNVLHHIRAYTNSLHLRAEDRLTLLGSYSFDAAVMDIFGTLLNGAELCLWDLKTQGVAGLAQWLDREQITVLHAVPTVFRAFAASLTERQKFSAVRLVVLGGEEVHRGDVELYRRHFAEDCLFVNGLGPTESTVALQYFLDHRTEIHRSTVPVGYAVDDTEIVLLDSQGRATELCGEVGIRSRYVALGYWRKPELTQAVFLPDPAGQARRIYRTGDLGRRLPDGAIQFLGRKGSRVKLRGHRIELGEIEETLVKHVSVREAVVVLGEEIPGDQRLLAYLVSDSKQTPGIEDLRSFLEDKLPDFMIPSSIIWLDSLPLTPNGKLDRAALPLPGLRRPLFERGSVSPRNAIEAKLVRIFERVLEVRPVGVTDNFFDLGGHSLLAVRLLTQIEKATGKRLPLSTLFKAQTVEEIAARLVNGGGLSAWSFLVAIQPGGSRPPFFCVHTIGGHALEYRELAHRLGSDQPFYALQALGLDGKQPALTRVEAMAACYVKEIRQVQPTGPYSVGGYSFGGKVAFEMARQLRAAGQKVALVALIDSYNFPPPPSRTGSHAAVKDIGFLWRRLRWHAGVLSRLEPKAMLRYFRAKAVTAFRWVRAKSEAYFEPVRFPVPRAVRGVKAANRQASRRYDPGPYEGRVVLFRASDWRLTGRDDPYLGWGQVCSGGLEVIEVDGDHDGVISEPQVRTLAHELAALLRGLGDCAAEAAQSETGVAISSSR
jgi:amino acid adenylation domain-containing protein